MTLCVIIGHFIFAVWCILHFGENMNQFEMEKLKWEQTWIYVVKSVLKRHEMILKVVLNVTVIFYFIHHHFIEHIKIPGKYDVNEKARSDVTQWRKLSQWRQGFEQSCCSKKVIFLQTSLKFAVAAFLEVRKIPIKIRENLQTSCQ